MESRAKLFGHPIHQMLIVFPLGLLAMGLLFDIIALFKDNGSDLHRAANYMIEAGIIGGLVAAVFGLIDWTGIPSGTRAKSIGLLHGGGNVVIVALFIIAWWLRRDAPQDPSNTAIVLEIIGGGLAL